jgi:hypothetical protein
VGFQGVTRFPNLNVRFPNFLPFSHPLELPPRPAAAAQPSQCGSSRGTRKHSTTACVLPKGKTLIDRRDRSCPFQQTSIEYQKLRNYRTRRNLRFSAPAIVPLRVQLGIGVRVTVILERPVWVALKKDAEWRWLRDRADSPWYLTMRLFRQPEIGEPSTHQNPLVFSGQIYCA